MNDMFEDALIEDNDEMSSLFKNNTNELPVPTVSKNDNEDEKYPDLEYPIYNEDCSKVYCQVCGKLFKTITQSHLKLHDDLTPVEYKQKYNTPMVSKTVSTKLKINTTKNKKNIFKQQEDLSPQEEVPIEEVNIPELIEEMGDDISFDQSIEDINDIGKVYSDPLYTKTEIAYNIEEIMGNTSAIENYFIEESSGSGSFPGTVQLKYSFITDIAIPELKVAFFFPDTYWHNREVAADPNKYKKLTEDGWKCIIIKGNNPKMDQIKQELRTSNLI